MYITISINIAKKTETIVKIPTKTKKNFVAFLAEFKPNRNYQFMVRVHALPRHSSLVN